MNDDSAATAARDRGIETTLAQLQIWSETLEGVSQGLRDAVRKLQEAVERDDS